MSRSVRILPITVLVALLTALLVACSDDPTDLAGTSGTTTPSTTQLPTGKLASMQGTTPRAASTAYFQDRLNEVAPELADPSFAAEAYDAVMVIGLAAELVRSDAPGRFANAIAGVTRGDHKCNAWSSCQKLAFAGGVPDYDGASGNIELTDTGVPSSGRFAVMRFDENDQLQRTSVKTAQSPAAAVQAPIVDPTLGPPADGQLTIGMLLPTSGPNASLGEGERAGVRAAIEEINDKSGVLGKPVELVDADESGNLATEVASLLNEGVDAIIGPATSDDVNAVLGQVTGAGVVLVSPSATASSLASVLDGGRFFQMSPPDTLQGQVLADVAAGDGVTNVMILAQQGTYGAGAAFDFAQAFGARGGSIVTVINFSATSLDPTVINAVLASSAGAFVIFGDLQPVGAIITSLSTAGKGPTSVPFYTGNISPDLANYVN